MFEMFEIRELSRRQAVTGSTIVTYQIVAAEPATIRVSCNGAAICTDRLTFELNLHDGLPDWLERGWGDEAE